MKAKIIKEWECACCGDRYASKKDAAECCNGEVEYDEDTEEDDEEDGEDD